MTFDELQKGDVIQFLEDGTFVAIVKPTCDEVYIGWKPDTRVNDLIQVWREDWPRVRYVGNYLEQLQGLETKAAQREFVKMLRASLG